MTISVTQLNNYIRGIIDIDGVLGDVTVNGEITNVKKSRDGWYFSLKDESASINCFCYDSITAPETGSVVIAEGQVNYFVRTGSVSLFVRRLTSTENTGAAFLKFVQLKEKLEKEGLFDPIRKKSVPKCCKTVGIVTSQTGAVIHDIVNVCLRRQPFTDLILYPVKVQGDGADDEISAGINYFNYSDVDVVIIGRGGGSNEDLSVFNSETVVRAVANCNKPVVSAVGHGVDFTLCDFAADKRAVTPSEAAEFVTIDVCECKKRVISVLERSSSSLSNNIGKYSDKVAYGVSRIELDIGRNLEEFKNRITQNLIVSQGRIELQAANLNNKVENNLNKLSSLNPLNVLKRGYARISKNNGAVKSVNEIDVGMKINITMYDGDILATVTDKVIK